MAESARAIVQGPPPQSAKEIVDLLTRLAAGAILIFYGTGFLVVSINDSVYGISVFSFLRAKLLAAGILLSIFVVFPILEGLRVSNSQQFQRLRLPSTELSSGELWLLRCSRYLTGLHASYVWAVFTYVFFIEETTVSPWRLVVVVLVLSAAVATISVAGEPGEGKRFLLPNILVSLGLVLGVAALYFLHNSMFTIRVLWFFTVGSFA